MSYLPTGAVDWRDIEKLIPVAENLGLKKVAKPLRAYVWYRKNPWILPVGIAAVIGIPFALGYAFGKRTKKRKGSR